MKLVGAKDIKKVVETVGENSQVIQQPTEKKVQNVLDYLKPLHSDSSKVYKIKVVELEKILNLDTWII